MLLHTVNKAAEHSSALRLCLRFAEAADTVLLLEDGVLAAVAGHPACEVLLAARARVVALRPDLEHRGVARKLHPAIAAIDYRDFVALCCACDKVQSWV